MTRYNKNVGDIGEHLALEHLQRHGYRILEQKYSVQGGEIDVVAKKDNTLIFVEVKTATSPSFGAPETWVDERKQQRLGLAAEVYMQRNTIVDVDCRFDVIAVDLSCHPPAIRHIQDAFWLEE